MRLTRFLLPLFLVALWPVSMVAVTLTAGNEVASPNSSDANTAPTRTDIDLVHPATHSGNVTTATVYWSSAGCTNALKIKFFHRTGDTLTMIAERGPFTSTSNALTVALTPPIVVQQGDLIGVARIANCGNPGSLVGFPSEGYLQYASDVTGSVAIAAADAQGGGVLALSGSGTATESVVRVFPVVGSTAGAFGSHFKTEMQFFNPQSSGVVSCKVVFHPAGIAGSSADPTRLVSLAPSEIFSTDDVVAAMGQSGTGSLDIIVAAGQPVPIILTRVYNDAGSSGTSSMTELGVPISGGVDAGTTLLARGVTGFLVTPRDPSRTRFNIGVRTLYSGATITVTVRNGAGVVVQTATRTYTANYFIQTDAASFVGGPIAGDQSIQITVSSGSAIVYGTTTDNITNDPAIQVVFGTFAIA